MALSPIVIATVKNYWSFSSPGSHVPCLGDKLILNLGQKHRVEVCTAESGNVTGTPHWALDTIIWVWWLNLGRDFAFPGLCGMRQVCPGFPGKWRFSRCASLPCPGDLFSYPTAPALGCAHYRKQMSPLETRGEFLQGGRTCSQGRSQCSVQHEWY